MEPSLKNINKQTNKTKSKQQKEWNPKAWHGNCTWKGVRCDFSVMQTVCYDQTGSLTTVLHQPLLLLWVFKNSYLFLQSTFFLSTSTKSLEITQLQQWLTFSPFPEKCTLLLLLLLLHVYFPGVIREEGTIAGKNDPSRLPCRPVYRTLSWFNGWERRHPWS